MPHRPSRFFRAAPLLLAAALWSPLCLNGQNPPSQFEPQANEMALSDKFTVARSASGAVLDGRQIGESGILWEATPNTVLVNDGDSEGVGTAEPKNMVGRLAVPSEASVISVEAAGRLTPAAKGKNWVAVGLGGGALGNPTFGGLYLLLDSDGRYILVFNRKPGDTTSSDVENLAIGPLTSFNPDGVNTLRLEVDKSRGVVNAWANDQLVAKDFSLAEKDIELDVTHVGFSAIHQVPGVPIFDQVSFRFSK